MNTICARTRVVAAAIGAGVVVTMGALTWTLSGTEAHAVTAHLNVTSNQTITQTTPPPEPQTPAAAPPVKAKKWQGNGWPGQ